MKKLTEELKKKHLRDTKGKVYLYLLEANRISFENGYLGFNIDSGIKTIESYINNKIDFIFDESEKTPGAYWDDKYKGYEDIYQAAKYAADDIISNTYSQKIIDFVKAAIKSYIPKIDEQRLQGQSSKIPRKLTEDEPIEYLALGITGEKKIKIKEKEEREEKERIEENIREEKEIIELTGGLGLGAAAKSLLDNDEEEEEEQETEDNSSDLSKNAADLL